MIADAVSCVAAQKTAPHVSVGHRAQQPVHVDNQRDLRGRTLDGLDHILDGRRRVDQCFLHV